MNHCIPLQPREQYDAMRGFNASLLKTAIRKTARHAWLAHLDPDREDKSTPALRIGTLFHTFVLEQNEWGKIVTCDHGSRTKAFQTARSQAEAAGVPFAATDEYELAQSLGQAVRNHPAIGHHFSTVENDWRNELTLAWECDGSKLKSRIDAIRFTDTEIIVFDLKSALDASPEGAGKAAYDGGWIIQGPFYRDAVEACLPSIEIAADLPEGSLQKLPIAFEFLTVEKPGDNQVGRYRLTPEQIELGRLLYRKAIKKMKAAESVDYWAGYQTAPRDLELPGWAERYLQNLLDEED